MRMTKASTFGLLLVAAGVSAQAPGPVKHVVIFDEPERYAGHPANSGIWSWGDEIVVGFTVSYYKEGPERPEVDKDRPSIPRQARSLDGGETWTIEPVSFVDADGKEKEPMPCSGGIDFTQPNFALRFRKADGDEGYSWFYWSNDRCKTWQGPYQLPTFDRKGIFARTDYIVNGKYDLMAFLTAAKDEGGEGRPFCAQTTDGGKSWNFVSWIGEHPGPRTYAIMPSTVRLSETELLTFVRCLRFEDEREEKRVTWLDPYRSLDNGKTWKLEGENTVRGRTDPALAFRGPGNPAHMIKLNDGRLALTYGYREKPSGIRARLSNDNGMTWSGDIVLRDDAGAQDVGYPRTAQRADGKIVTVYYFNAKDRKERFIAATIWEPGKK